MSGEQPTRVVLTVYRLADGPLAENRTEAGYRFLTCPRWRSVLDLVAWLALALLVLVNRPKTRRLQVSISASLKRQHTVLCSSNIDGVY